MIQLRLPHHSLFKLLVASGMMLLMAVVMLLFSDRAFAHGYVESPGSRGYLCSLGQNKNCGEIIYEPYSLEGLKGFPQAGPADGKIASAAVGRFSELDQQSATRWSKVPMTAGTKTFSWVLKVPHATSSWKYYMTKQNWDQNAPLSRASFDLTPFCSVNYGGKMPPKTYSDTCNVPSRTGYQVILAVWEIADTANAFYNVIDVNFGGDPSDNQPPTAPAGLSASNLTATSVSLAWNASSDNVGVSGYKIYNGATQIAAVSGSTLNYNVTGLTSNTSYTFTVRAQDAAGNVSGASNAVTVTTPAVPVDNEAPTAPTGLHVMGTPTSSSVHLMWSASTDNVGVTGYRVYNGTTLVTTVSGTTLEYMVTGLTPDTSYTFTVRAIDASGNVSADSNAVNAKTASGPAVSAWAPNVAYTVGTLVTYNGKTYECRQAHTSLVGWEPSNAASLWLLK